MISSLVNVFNGTYSSCIQDALGNSGASAMITTGSGGSVQISGQPTGAGLKIRAAETSTSVQGIVSSGRDTISFSPAARAALNRQEIALDLMANVKFVSNTAIPTSAKSVSKTETPVTNTAASQSTSSQATEALDDVTALAEQNPTQVIQDAVSAAQAAISQISNNHGFYAAVAGNPSLVQQIGNGMPDDLGSGFAAAVKAGTVTVQSGQEAGWDVGGGISFTGTSMQSTAGSTNGRFDTTNTNVVCADFGYGQIVFSWPK